MSLEYSGKDNLDAMRHAVNYNNYLHALIARDLRKSDLVVDFGAGSGTFARPLNKNGQPLICVETDNGLAVSLEEEGMTVVRDMQRIDSESIDRIYSLNVLEHIENDQDILDLWFRKIKTGGSILIYVPAFQILYSKMDQKVGHVRRYSKHELVAKVQKAGFKITEAKYADSLGFFSTLLYKLSPQNNGDIDPQMLKAYDRWVFPWSKRLDHVLSDILGKNVMVRAVKE